jgi:hypothetical protein
VKPLFDGEFPAWSGFCGFGFQKRILCGHFSWFLEEKIAKNLFSEFR